jgi:hypothetical protein
MKKTKFLISLTAMLAVSVMFTSCWRASEDRPTKTETTTIDVQSTYELVVSSNVAAKFEVTGQAAVTNTTATFSGLTAKTVTVKATATDAAYTIPSNSQEMTVTFSEDKSSAAVEFTFAKESANQVAQEDAKGSTVTNDAENKDAFGEVTITVPAAVNITGNTTDPFSVVAYQPAEEPKVEDNTAEVPALTLKCEPDGAQFDPALDVKAYVGVEAAGMQVVINDTEYTVDDEGYVTFKAGHFSLWNLFMCARIDRITEGTEDLYDNPSFVFSQGGNQITYTENFGYEIRNGSAVGIVKKLMKCLFGAEKTKFSKITTISTRTAGTGRLRIYQEYYDLKIICGNRDFTARIYGKVKCEITAPSTVAPQGHSGGSAQ